MSKDTHIIDVKTKGAKKSQQQIKGVGGALKGMAKQAGIAAAAYFGSRALLQGIQSSIDLFGEQELSEKKLEAALGKTSDALLNQAKALQQVTMFGDETIISAQAMIASFVKDEEAVKAATIATMDLAAAKGFDLVAAADLVSKTLGSSTNALTRYGIEVTGAVGSTERLTSLTENIAAVFGGQATQQANTMAGSIQQMKNAMGDAGEVLGETLAPAVTAIAGKMKAAAEAFQGWVRATTETSTERAIREIKELGGNTTDLELSLNRLQQSTALERIGGQARKTSDIQGDINEQLTKQNTHSADRLALMEEISSIEQQTGMTRLNRSEEFLSLQDQINAAQGGTLRINGELADQEYINNLQRKLNRQEDFEDKQNNHTDIIENLNEEMESVNELNGLRIEENALIEKSNTLQNQKTDSATDEKNAIIDMAKFRDKAHKSRKKQEAEVLGQVQATGEFKKVEAFKEGMRTAYGMAGKAYEAFAAIPIIGPALGVAAAAVAFALGAGYANKMMSAQYGADFVTDGPQLMMVGEGSGPERVQVTPLVDENIDGPQGGNITLNISGNVLTEEFTEGTLIPQIKEGLRLGNDMGV